MGTLTWATLDKVYNESLDVINQVKQSKKDLNTDTTFSSLSGDLQTLNGIANGENASYADLQGLASFQQFGGQILTALHSVESNFSGTFPLPDGSTVKYPLSVLMTGPVTFSFSCDLAHSGWAATPWGLPASTTTVPGQSYTYNDLIVRSELQGPQTADLPNGEGSVIIDAVHYNLTVTINNPQQLVPFISSFAPNCPNPTAPLQNLLNGL